MEFSTELYIEIDDKILTLQGFRRQFPQLKVESIETEDIEELMEKEFVGKKIDMEFNEGDENESKKESGLNGKNLIRIHSANPHRSSPWG